MATPNASAQASMPTVPAGLVTLPKRTLRKGTRSCAECKRRKTRCYFDQLNATICVGCQRRGTSCISQEHVDVPMSNIPQDPQMGGRLRKMESMLDMLVQKVFPQQNTSQHVPVDQRSSASPNELPAYLDVRVNIGDDASHIVGSSVPTRATKSTSPSQGAQSVSDGSSPHRDKDPVKPTQSLLSRHANTCRVLYDAFPSQEDAKRLFDAGRSSVFLQAICNPYSELFRDGQVLPAAHLSVLPPLAVHPVILARKLLQLALCIQQLDPSIPHSSLGLHVSPLEAEDRYFHLAMTMVTCHDDLLDSLEGLECLMYEGVYLVNRGNLRQALTCLRRAATLAQFMGLHRQTQTRTQKQHDPSTRVSGAVTWTHIAYLERYISLLLGLPSSISCVRFASETLSDEMHAEWVEKLQIDVCGDIIARNERGHYDVAVTQKIDQVLTGVASTVPTKWWSPMDLRPDMNEEELMFRMISAQMQIIHYNLLTVAHLPYLLHDAADQRFDYSKSTCTYASREVLTRHTTFRSIVKLVYCCRPVDFCAFTAILTLLLAHIGSHGRESSRLLAHQRLGDRALIHKSIETLDELNRLNHDELSRETARLARRLMDLEAASWATGDSYRCFVVHDERSGLKSAHAFDFKIPYFGTVRLAPESPAPASDMDPFTEPSSASLAADNEPQLSSLSIHTGSEPTPPSEHIQLGPPLQHTALDDEQQSFQTDCAPVDYNDFGMLDVDMPDIFAGDNDWAFQGVDAAFFDALINGNVVEYNGFDEGWSC